MKTSSAKKYSLLLKFLVASALICIVGIVFFFVRIYQRDMQALTDFMASYRTYDQAITAASASVFAANGKNASTTSEEETRADVALSDLKTKSSVRISSLIKNEKEAMRAMQEIADLSTKEMNALKTYRTTIGQDANWDGLEQDFHDLTKARQAAFSHFQGLGR